MINITFMVQVRPSTQMSMEWSVFVFLLSTLTKAEKACNKLCHERLVALDVEGKTNKAGSSVSIPAAAAMKSGNTECPICPAIYSDTLGDGLVLEQAVKARCNHVFGAECPEAWVESGQDNARTCPTCRENPFERSMEWPTQHLASLAHDYQAFFGGSKGRRLDRKIDVFLYDVTSGDQSKLHDRDFGKLLHKMNNRVLELKRHEDEFREFRARTLLSA